MANCKKCDRCEVNTKLRGLLISAVEGNDMKGHLIVGIIDIIVGLACFVLCIILNRTDWIMISLFPIAMGLGNVAEYISYKKHHKKRMEELVKMWGTKDE